MPDRMTTQPPIRPSLSRRSLFRAAGLGATGLLGCSGTEGDPIEPGTLTRGASLPRVGIIGGGAGGLAAAYFLEGAAEVHLFESRSKFGGHCDSHTLQVQGYPVTVDLGAQFFHPDTHPIYTTLLEELGLYDPEHPDSDETIEATGSVCIFPSQGGWPLLSSTLPLLTPFHAANFAVYTQYARQAILGNMDWEITVKDWIDSLILVPSFKRDVLLPWISALIGTSRSNADRSSARSILQTFALAFPENLLEGATTFNSRIGLGGNLDRLIARAPSAAVHLQSPARELRREGSMWHVTTPSGDHGPFDFLIMNAPPHTSRGLLAALPWASEMVAALDDFEYFDARLVIHTDAAYMHRSKAFWAVYNAGVDGGECEGSVWYGGIQGRLPNGAQLNLFKSWAHSRPRDPRQILLERRFRHPLITPAVVRAARVLKTFQCQNGLYFSGQHTTGFDLQEAAVYSAMQAVRDIAPSAPLLESLEARLEQRGRSGISYEL